MYINYMFGHNIFLITCALIIKPFIYQVEINGFITSPANCLNSALPLSSRAPSQPPKATAAAHRYKAAQSTIASLAPREIKHFRLQYRQCRFRTNSATRPDTNPSMANSHHNVVRAVFCPHRECATPPAPDDADASHLHLCQQQQHTAGGDQHHLTSSARLTCSST